jgi:hypothetical protein
MISAAQVREALALLGWTSPTLAKQALLAFDDVNRALDDSDVRRLGGLQLGALRAALEAAGVEFVGHSRLGVRLRKAVP